MSVITENSNNINFGFNTNDNYTNDNYTNDNYTNNNDTNDNDTNDNDTNDNDTNNNDTNDIKNIDEVPDHLKDEYITQYVIGRNHRECISNLFKLHNESVNSWTMIISNLSVLLIIIYIFMRTQFSRLYSFVFILHLLAYTIHTPFSVGYHTFNTIDKDEYIKWRKYDVYGIFLRNIILTFTLSFFTYSDFKYVLINTSVTIAIVYYSLLKFKENEDKHEPLDKVEQGKLIGYTVLSLIYPVLYKIYLLHKQKKFNILYYLCIIIIFTTIIGGSFYCFRFPEKYFEPGTFNKIGSSHNLMHLGIIIVSICEVLYVYYCAKEGNHIKSFK